MAKVLLEISAEGMIEVEEDRPDVLSRLFDRSQRLGKGSFYQLETTPRALQYDIEAIVGIPDHLAHLRWRVGSLSILHDGKLYAIHNGVSMTLEEYHLLNASFGHGGSCGCDDMTGGCPLCDGDKTRRWKEDLDRLNSGLR
jgi:hypothetical protein